MNDDIHKYSYDLKNHQFFFLIVSLQQSCHMVSMLTTGLRSSSGMPSQKKRFTEIDSLGLSFTLDFWFF